MFDDILIHIIFPNVGYWRCKEISKKYVDKVYGKNIDLRTLKGTDRPFLYNTWHANLQYEYSDLMKISDDNICLIHEEYEEESECEITKIECERWNFKMGNETLIESGNFHLSLGKFTTRIVKYKIFDGKYIIDEAYSGGLLVYRKMETVESNFLHDDVSKWWMPRKIKTTHYVHSNYYPNQQYYEKLKRKIKELEDKFYS